MTPLRPRLFTHGPCRLVAAAPFALPAGLRGASSQPARREARRPVQPRAKLKELSRLRSGPKVEEWDRLPAATELSWSSPLSIIRYPDPRLRAMNRRIGVFDESLQRLVHDLLECMYSTDDGVGLAAPQTGVNLRLMVFNPSGERGSPQEVALVNPRLLGISGGMEVDGEGCLSFPHIYADVKRRTKVQLEAQDLQGNTRTLSLADFPARVFLHEYDHLQGRLFHDRMAADQQRKIQGDLWKLEEAYKREHPGVAVEHFAAV